MTPSARQAPRTNVVLPAPSSPETATTSPAREPARRAAPPSASVSSAERGQSTTCSDAAVRDALRRGRAEPAARAPRLRSAAGASRRRARGAARRCGRAAPGAARSPSRAPRASAACRARPPDGRADRAVTRDAAEHDLLLAAVHLRDPVRLAGEQLRREVAERRDDLRPDQLDLPEEVRLAGLDLLGLRVAVAGRAALEDVRDVDVLARQPDAGEQLAEQLARRRRRTARPACPRGSPAPRRRTSGRRSASPSRRRPACGSAASAQRVQPATASP